MLRRRKKYIFSRKRGPDLRTVLLVIVIIIALSLVGLFIYFNLFGTASRVHLVDNLVAEAGEEKRASDFIKSLDGASLKDDPIIDTTDIGEQKVNITLDVKGNERKYDFTVKVVDTKAPDIECADSFNLVVNSPFDLKEHIEVFDRGEIEPEIHIDNPPDMKKAGEYKAKIKATDQAGNVGEKEVLIKVIDPELIEGDYSFTTANGFKAERKDGITYVDGQIIANKSFSLPPTYGPGGIINEAFSQLIAMQKDAAAEGLNIFTLSGYRSYNMQSRIYNSYVAKDGKEKADRYSSRPGYSDHQTGYAVDVNSVEVSFKDTPEGKWINANAYRYGYVIRYPQGKEEMTGYMFEPWHLRYVGKALAQTLYNGGDWISLEEYYGIPSVYTSQVKP